MTDENLSTDPQFDVESLRLKEGEAFPGTTKRPKVIDLDEMDTLRAERNILKSELLNRDRLALGAQIKAHQHQLMMHLDEMSTRYGVNMQEYDFREGKAVLIEEDPSGNVTPLPMREKKE